MPYKNKGQKRLHQILWRDKRKMEAQRLLGGQCAWCGATEDLEFDHIDPTTKTNNITRMISYKWTTVLKELAKCQLLCATCNDHKMIDNDEIPACRKGEDHPSSKMTESQMREALRLYRSGKYTFRQLGEIYGVHKDTIRKANDGSTWTHLGE